MNNANSYCVMCKNPESLCNCVDSVQAFAQAHVTSHDGKALIDGDTLTVLILRALEWAADRSRGPSHKPSKDIVRIARDRIKSISDAPIPCKCEGCLLAEEIVRLADACRATPSYPEDK